MNINTPKLRSSASEIAAAIERRICEIRPPSAEEVCNGAQDALAAYNRPFVENVLKYKWLTLSSEQFNRIKGLFPTKKRLPDDASLAYFMEHFLDIGNVKNYAEIHGKAPFIWLSRLKGLSFEQKEKLFNSELISIALKSTEDSALKYKYFNFLKENIDDLEKFSENDFFKACISKYFKQEHNVKIYSTEEIIEDLRKSASSIVQFSKQEKNKKIIELLDNRNYQDINILSETITKKTSGLSEQQIEEFHSILKVLLESKLPNGEFVFEQKKICDVGQKKIISGIVNILNARVNNQKNYTQLMEILKYTEEGKIPPSVLGTLAEQGKLNDEFLTLFEKMKKKTPSIFKFANKTEGFSNTKLGDVLEINEKLYYRYKNELKLLNMSKDCFEELFPQLETMAMSQGPLNNCYFVSAVFDFFKNPNTRGKIFEMFSQKGNNIVITLPDAEKFPIIFQKDSFILNNSERKINASLGIQMLESAYKKTRSLMWELPDDFSIISGGMQSSVYNTFLGKNKAHSYIVGEIKTNDKIKEEILDAIKEHKAELLIQKEKLKTEPTQFRQILVENIQTTIRYFSERLKEADNLYHISENNLRNILLKYGTDDKYIISAGTNSGKPFWDEAKLIQGGHAYSILKVDSNKQTVNLVNPYNTAQHTTLSFDDFEKYFNGINIVQIK